MKPKAITLAEGLPFPADEAATQVYAFMGRRGSGKTYAAGRLVEQLLDGGHQVVVLDPVGVWYGLRLGKDGKSPGFPIPVIGGEHGDVPLGATGGDTVARLVATRALSAVLDVSEFSGTELHRFVGDFASALLHAKKRARSPLMVVFEEAQEMVPQNVRGDLARMVGAVEKLVKLGRNFGIGTALVSQRPQAVNKDVLNQTEAMLCFQLTGPQERKAISGWVQEKGAGARDVADELPSLPRGTAMIWSPQWLGAFGRYQILPKRTYDASATPLRGRVESASLTPIDLAELREAMATTDASVHAGEGQLHRAEVNRLRRELAAARAAAAAPVIERVPFVPAEIVQAAARAEEALRAAAKDVAHLVEVVNAHTRGSASRGTREARPERTAAPAPVRASDGGVGRRADAANGSTRRGADGLPAGARAILRALAQRDAPLTRSQAATLAGLAPSSGTTATYVSLLVTRGFVARDGNLLTLTPVGARTIGPVPKANTPRELVDLWRQRLDGKAKAMLELLALEHGPLTKAEIAERVQLANSGTFATYLSKLKANNLVEKTSAGYVINPMLAL
jgi:hypothetical protein